MAADQIRDWLTARYPSPKAESPIEHLFFAAYEFMKPHLMLPENAGLQMVQQREVGRYRADFYFQIRNVEKKLKEMVVEVDGHEFHERTKAQATRDRSRDRWMDDMGILVVRFTGSEVWANPFSCVEQVGSRIYRLRHGCNEREARARAGFEAIYDMLGRTPDA